MGGEVHVHGIDLPAEALSSVIRRAIRESESSVLAIASAYVSTYGVDFVCKLRRRLGIEEVRLVCDISDVITHPNALRMALNDDWNVKVYDLPAGTFHPKIMLGGLAFNDDGSVADTEFVLIGSSNLTYGGLVRNHECNLLAVGADCPDNASTRFAELWAGGLVIDQDAVIQYEERFAKRNRDRSPEDLHALGIADSGNAPEAEVRNLMERRGPYKTDRTFSTASAEAAWAGLESFTGEYTLQVEFPRDAGHVLRNLAGGEAGEVIRVHCDDAEIRQMRIRYYADNGMFRANIPNDTPEVAWVRENHSGIAVLTATGNAEVPLKLAIHRPGSEASTVIGRSVALGTWGKTTTRLYGWY